ncbi:MAG: GAF domain-containing protein [Proteobacteria bacterium]|nr:GAF domain-containing protein [Pseudomonadota bacterium]MBU1688847.1 GAF domain-containing protein [Pseudomonadota bacterium]
MKSSQIEQWLQGSPVLKNLPVEVVVEIRSFAEKQVSRIHELVKIGMALSAEKQLDRLLEMIVSEARRFTNADGGTLYIKSEDNVLEFMIIQNDSLGIRMGGTGKKISWPPVDLQAADGVENHRNVSAHCALVGKHVNIDDVYRADFDFQGTKEFDATTGYRSKSMLLVPLRDHEDEVIGVLQLLNALDSASGEVVPFPPHEIEDVTSLASQAAIAITNARLIRELENLLNAFLQAIAAAIDEKSHYTAGHVARVADLTERIALAINKAEEGRFAEVHFSDDELDELKMAAWMHDVGKVTTPEYVVDKATKLQTIFDRIDLIRSRAEILKRDVQLADCIAGVGEVGGAAIDVGTGLTLEEIGALLAFLEEVNIGGEFLSDEKIMKLKEIGAITYQENGQAHPLLTEEEIDNLSIRKGTLNQAERSVINNHVTLTMRMLEKLPFPRKLSNVPRFAGMHHEKLDGTGYPNGLKEAEIPLQARILAVADVFEALTAADRPYKPGKKLSESMKILGFMVKDRHLDGDICDLLVESGLAEYYGCQVLSERQRDNFFWKGEEVSLACSPEDQLKCLQGRPRESKNS